MSELKTVEIYTDGACLGNPGPGGYGAVLIFGQYRKEISGGYAKTTNNRMELMAAIEGLSALKERCLVSLYSDSKYLVDSYMQGSVRRWQANGWKRDKKSSAKNVDLWKRILSLCGQHDVKFVWVEGHSGNPSNERCDRLSELAAQRKDLAVDEVYEQSLTKSTADSLFGNLPE